MTSNTRVTKALCHGRRSSSVVCLLALLVAVSTAPAFAALPYSEGGPAGADPGAGNPHARYVDAVNGDDGKDGASPATAWRTLGKADVGLDALPPGGMLLFKRGQQFQGNLTTDNNGTAGNRITIGTYGPVTDPRPEITDPGTADDREEASIYLNGEASYLMVRDIECARIAMFQGANNCVIYNCEVHGSSNTGIISGGGTHHNAIVGNLVYGMRTNDGIGIHDEQPAWEKNPAWVFVQDSFWVVDNVVIGDGNMEECYDQATERYPHATDFKVIKNRFQCRSVPPSTAGEQCNNGLIANYRTKYAWYLGNIVTEAPGTQVDIGPISYEAHAWVDGPGHDMVGACDYVQISGNVIYAQTSGSPGRPRDPLFINTSHGTVEHNTVVTIANGRGALKTGNRNTTTDVRHNLFARSKGNIFSSLVGPATALSAMDHNWFDDLTDTGSYTLSDLTLAKWRSTYGFDVHSGTGDSGIRIPAKTAFNDDPYNWHDPKFLAHFIPDKPLPNNPGAFDAKGTWLGLTMVAFPGLTENGGYGWEGPLLVQERYPLPCLPGPPESLGIHRRHNDDT